MVKSPMFHVTNYQRVCHNPQESLNRPQRLVGGQTDPQRHRDPTKMMGGSTKKKCLLHQPFDGDLSKSGWAKWGKWWQMMGFFHGRVIFPCMMATGREITGKMPNGRVRTYLSFPEIAWNMTQIWWWQEFLGNCFPSNQPIEISVGAL
jgi:hypothetical protein